MRLYCFGPISTKVLLGCASLFFLFSSSLGLVMAEIRPLKGGSEVSAVVGEYFLSVSGYVSPFASIALSSNGIFYRATVADEQGNFSLSGIRINEGFKSFCLLAKDYHNLGESYACFSFPPATGDIVMKDIFLPPTIALERSEITSGGEAKVFGYSMPKSLVRLHMGDKLFTTEADSEGRYTITMKSIPSGTYNLYADANYKGKDSEKPSRTVQLKALPWGQQLIKYITDLLKRLWRLLIGLPFGFLWLAFPFLFLIPLLIIKIWPERFTWIYNSKLLYFINGRKRKLLHHAWFVGF